MRSSTFDRRTGFTLIELLVVIVIIGILAALSLGVFLRQLDIAKRRATASLIQNLNDAVQERWLSVLAATRTAPPLSTTRNQYGMIGDGTDGSGVTAELLVVRNARADHVARLDALRAEFPQHFSDFMRGTPDSVLPGIVEDTVTITTSNGAVPYGGAANPSARTSGRTAIYQEYLKRIGQVDGSNPYNPATSYPPIPTNPANPINHDPNTESSECLYLLLTTTSRDATSFNVDQIEGKFIDDTDDDGLKEFVDAWGNPLRFYRWPTDYLEYLIKVDGSVPSSVANFNSLDPSGLMTRTAWNDNSQGGVNRRTAFEVTHGYYRLHVLYGSLASTPPITPNPLVNQSVPTAWTAYPLIPLIVSAGPDGAAYKGNPDLWRAFGLAWPANGEAPTLSNLDVRSGRVGGTTASEGGGGFTGDPDMLDAVADNIVSASIRSGQGN